MADKNVILKGNRGDMIYPIVSPYTILTDYSLIEFDTTEIVSFDSSVSTATLGLAMLGQMMLGNG